MAPISTDVRPEGGTDTDAEEDDRDNHHWSSAALTGSSRDNPTLIRLRDWKARHSHEDDEKSEYGGSEIDATTNLLGTDGLDLTLGEPEPKTSRRPSWFSFNSSASKGKEIDFDAVATQPSVFDDPDLAPQYQPRHDWENIHRFDPTARWTWREEKALVRKIDLKIMVWTCLMFCALEMDRANIRQAVTDNLLPELGLGTNDYNIGNSLFALSFLLAEVPSQLVSKWLGPDRWIPIQMVIWSVIASSQFTLSGRTGFLVSRVLLGIMQGGFIPTVVLYLSYFYKSHELSVRLGFFWAAMVVADIFAAFSAFALLHMRGVLGYSGWRWLFLVEGIITMVFGLLSFGLMPAGPTQTASWFRGKKGWFTAREEVILVNRVIRDDPSKGGMHNREPITLRLLWKSLCDYDLWPMYIIGLLNHIPFATPNIYLTLSLKGMGFTTFQTNLLVIPSQLLHVMNMVILTYLSEALNQLSLVAAIPQFWAIPFLLWLRFVDTSEISKWTIWLVMTVFLGNPYAHPIQVGWVSRNSNTVRSRTIGAAMYNMCVQGGSIIASNIYRQDDAPHYKRGNSVLLTVVFINIAIYLTTKAYYTYKNNQRDRVWNAMTDQQRAHYLATTSDAGNKRLDFRFAS